MRSLNAIALQTAIDETALVISAINTVTSAAISVSEDRMTPDTAKAVRCLQKIYDQGVAMPADALHALSHRLEQVSRCVSKNEGRAPCADGVGEPCDLGVSMGATGTMACYHQTRFLAKRASAEVERIPADLARDIGQHMHIHDIRHAVINRIAPAVDAVDSIEPEVLKQLRLRIQLRYRRALISPGPEAKDLMAQGMPGMFEFSAENLVQEAVDAGVLSEGDELHFSLMDYFGPFDEPEELVAMIEHQVCGMSTRSQEVLSL